MRPVAKAVAVVEHLPVSGGRRDPAVDDGRLPDAVEIDVRQAAVGSRAADHADLVAVETVRDRRPGRVRHVDLFAEILGVGDHAPGPFIRQRVVVGNHLGIVARDGDRRAAVVPDGHETVAGGQRLHGVAVPVEVASQLERLAVGGHLPRAKRQPHDVHAAGRGVEHRVLDAALAVDNPGDDAAGRRTWFSRWGPNSGSHSSVSRPKRIGPIPISSDQLFGGDLAAVDVVLALAALVKVVETQDDLPPRDLSRPRAIRLRGVSGEVSREKRGANVQRPAAARRALGIRPRAAVNVAVGLGTDAGVVEIQAQDVANVVPPVGKGVLVVHQVLRDPAGGDDALHGVLPVPVVPAPGVPDVPLRQQRVAEVRPARVASLRDRAVLAGVAEANQLVQEQQHVRDAAGLEVAVGLLSPGDILGIGIATPRRDARPVVALLGEHVAPMLGRLEVPRVAGQLIHPQHPLADAGGEVQLDVAAGASGSIGLAAARNADRKPRPGGVGPRLVVVQQRNQPRSSRARTRSGRPSSGSTEAATR